MGHRYTIKSLTTIKNIRQWSCTTTSDLCHQSINKRHAMNLPLLTACRNPMLTWQASRALGTSLIYWRTNYYAKPAFEAALLSWKSDHENSPINTHNQGRALDLPLKRVAQRRTSKRLRHTAQLVERPHNQHRIHDGQEWPALGHSLPTSQSGQE